MNKVKYEQLAPLMDTGDIMLFNGKYSGSKFIEFLEGSQWSHVGMIVRLEGYDQPLIFEATSLTNIPDAVFKDQKTGIKIVDLKSRLEHYGDDLEKYEEANFAYKRLNVQRTDEMRQKVNELIHSMHAIPDPGFWEMVWNVLIGRFLHIGVKLNKYFCSEFVAEAYVALGLLSNDKPINGYIPSDFSDKGRLQLLQGKFDPEIMVQINHI